MNKMIAPSMMCADILTLKSTLETFEKKGIEYLHIDVMDGAFVPNFSLSPDYCKGLKKGTKIPLDIHLMVERPEDKIDWFPIEDGDFVSVHAEATNHLDRVISKIKEKGAKAMVAINPATPLNVLENVLYNIDGVLIMSVNPGFAGQKLVPSSLNKIRDLRTYLDNKGYKDIVIEVDGNVSFENAKKMSECGADIFVGGTSSVFCKDDSIENNIDALRKAIALK